MDIEIIMTLRALGILVVGVVIDLSEEFTIRIEAIGIINNRSSLMVL